MTALMGKTLLFFACLWIGWDRARRRKVRIAWLRDFRRALADLGRELTFSLEPLDRLMERAAQGNGPAAPYFDYSRDCFKTSGGESWAESWKEALEKDPLPLRETDQPLLSQVGEILGRWDGETQEKALADLLSRLDETIFDGAEEAKRLFRVDLTLGITAGLFCVLLL